MQLKSKFLATMYVALSLMAVAFISGCDNDKKILDVETPNGGVEIEQDRDTGAIEVETRGKED